MSDLTDIILEETSRRLLRRQPVDNIRIHIQDGIIMQNELEGLYNMLVSQTDIMKNVDELVEKQIEHELPS